MIISGANNLYNNREAVDDLNVFPVPDGDTGTNMSLTAAAMVEELKNSETKSIEKAADKMAFATLRGARGNSGVILSQLFKGMSKSLKGKDSCTPSELAEALDAGSKTAYKAVMKPTEGTILTVAREAAEGAQDADMDTIESVIEAAVNRGEEALKHTTEQLPALQEAGVVDAGGQGWMYILEGALEFLHTGKTVKSSAPVKRGRPAASEAAQAKTAANIRFKYCTEFIIEKKKKTMNVDKFRETIKPKGNCMLVIDDDDVVKVHIHTNHPGFVIEEAIKLGEIMNLKIDNMKRQHNSIINGEAKPVEVAGKKLKAASEAPAEQETDKIPEAPAASETEPAEIEAKPNKKQRKATKAETVKEFGFAAVCAGRGMADMLRDLGVDRIIEGGQSMNPSTHDIVKAITKIKAKTVFVFPNNKNIVMAANQAIELIGNKKVVVIPTVNIPQCVKSLMAFNPQRTADENEQLLTKAMGKVKAGQITYAVRNTEIDGNSVSKGDILGLTDEGISYIGKDLDDVLVEMIADYIDEDTEYVTVYYGKDIKPKNAAKLEEMFSEKYEDEEIEVSFKKGGQPLYYYIVSVE